MNSGFWNLPSQKPPCYGHSALHLWCPYLKVSFCIFLQLCCFCLSWRIPVFVSSPFKCVSCHRETNIKPKHQSHAQRPFPLLNFLQRSASRCISVGDLVHIKKECLFLDTDPQQICCKTCKFMKLSYKLSLNYLQFIIAICSVCSFVRCDEVLHELINFLSFS